MQTTNLSRRGFLAAGGMLAATAGGCRSLLGGSGTDENLSVFLSDIHISGVGQESKWGGLQPTYQNPLLDRAIDQVLAMCPRPKRCVVFGDMALWFGWISDSKLAAEKLKRITDAGIELYVTTGNHDHRKTLFEAFPKQRELTPVPGYLTSVIDLGTADLFLLDTLDESLEGDGAYNNVAGDLSKAQADWLLQAVKAAKRPFLVGGHHPPKELTVDGGVDKKGKPVRLPLLAELEKSPFFAGFVHGHNHRWTSTWAHIGYSKRKVIRVACLPSTGWWGTIGFGVMRTYADRAELALAEGNDFFFPSPLPDGEARPREWDDIIDEETGAKTIFRY